MADWSTSYKVCATCAYWIAQRDADLYGARAIKCANEGRCAIHQGPYRNMTRSASSNCQKWEKWPVLK